MAKKYKSTDENFSDQRRLLLLGMLERQHEKLHQQQELSPPATKPKRFALDEFVEKYPRRLKSIKNRRTLSGR